MKRILLVLSVSLVIAAVLAATAATALAKPPKCPPGQTATVEVVGEELVETCRVL